jgi:hypothetical protein
VMQRLDVFRKIATLDGKALDGLVAWIE